METMLGKVRQLSAEAFFGEDSVQKSHERGTGGESLEVAGGVLMVETCGFMLLPKGCACVVQYVSSASSMSNIICRSEL